MVSRRRYWTASAIVIVSVHLALLGCADSSSDASLRPTLAIDRVLAPSDLPARLWPTQGWELGKVTTLKPELVPTEGKVQTWQRSDRSGAIQQEVLRFESVKEARRYFRTADPRSFDEDFPLRVNASGSYTSRTGSPDEIRVYCLGFEGSIDACGVWTYWARYGQYVLRFDHVAGLQASGNDTFVSQPGIGLTQFLGYVGTFDKQVSEALRQPGAIPS
jgi:hypothetical protein